MSNMYGTTYPKILLQGDAGSGQTTIITVNFDITGITISPPMFIPQSRSHRALNGDLHTLTEGFLMQYIISYQIPNDTNGNILMNEIDTIIQWRHMSSYTVGVVVYEDLRLILYPHNDESQNYNVHVKDFERDYIEGKIIGYEGKLILEGTEYIDKNTYISQTGTFA